MTLFKLYVQETCDNLFNNSFNVIYTKILLYFDAIISYTLRKKYKNKQDVRQQAVDIKGFQ